MASNLEIAKNSIQNSSNHSEQMEKLTNVFEKAKEGEKALNQLIVAVACIIDHLEGKI